MKKILEEFLSDPGMVERILMQRVPEHQVLLERISEKRMNLEKRLGMEERQLLEEFSTAVNSESCAFGTDRFVKGFELGVLITTEIFEDGERFLTGRMTGV